MAAPKGNKFWMLADWGKPAKYNSPDEMYEKITEYLKKTYKRGKFTPTVSGLSFYLGFHSKSSLDDYCKVNEAYSSIIYAAKKFIESCYENQLYTNASAGAVFALKNMGWKDRSEIDHKNDGGKFNDLSEDEINARITKLTGKTGTPPII